MKHYLPQFMHQSDSLAYSMLNKNITQQAMVIGYVDDFKIMMVCSSANIIAKKSL